MKSSCPSLLSSCVFWAMLFVLTSLLMHIFLCDIFIMESLLDAVYHGSLSPESTYPHHSIESQDCGQGKLSVFVKGKATNQLRCCARFRGSIRADRANSACLLISLQSSNLWAAQRQKHQKGLTSKIGTWILYYHPVIPFTLQDNSLFSVFGNLN